MFPVVGAVWMFNAERGGHFVRCKLLSRRRISSDRTHPEVNFRFRRGSVFLCSRCSSTHLLAIALAEFTALQQFSILLQAVPEKFQTDLVVVHVKLDDMNGMTRSWRIGANAFCFSGKISSSPVLIRVVVSCVRLCIQPGVVILLLNSLSSLSCHM